MCCRGLERAAVDVGVLSQGVGDHVCVAVAGRTRDGVGERGGGDGDDLCSLGHLFRLQGSATAGGEDHCGRALVHELADDRRRVGGAALVVLDRETHGDSVDPALVIDAIDRRADGGPGDCRVRRAGSRRVLVHPDHDVVVHRAFDRGAPGARENRDDCCGEQRPNMSWCHTASDNQSLAWQASSN